MYFYAIDNRFRARGIMQVYKAMVEHNLTFFPAVKKALGWSREQLDREVRRVLGL